MLKLSYLYFLSSILRDFSNARSSVFVSQMVAGGTTPLQICKVFFVEGADVHKSPTDH